MRRIFVLLAQGLDRTHRHVLRQPQKVQKPCTGGYMVATWPKKEKARYRIDSALSFAVLVPERGIEPPTFSLRMSCSTN